MCVGERGRCGDDLSCSMGALSPGCLGWGGVQWVDCVHTMVQLFLNRYNLVAASAAGVVPFCDWQQCLTVGSYLGRQCQSCCERASLRVTFPPHDALELSSLGPSTVHHARFGLSLDGIFHH
jgi:hypothetical protein